VHGIIPSSLIDRASEVVLGPPDGVKSSEGQGKEVVEGDYEGRMTTEVTQGMHEVCAFSIHPSTCSDLQGRHEGENCKGLTSSA